MSTSVATFLFSKFCLQLPAMSTHTNTANNPNSNDQFSVLSAVINAFQWNLNNISFNVTRRGASKSGMMFWRTAPPAGFSGYRLCDCDGIDEVSSNGPQSKNAAWHQHLT